MKLIKRIIYVAIAAMIMTPTCMISASAVVMTDSYFKYEVNFIRGEATITSCLTDESDLFVPSYYMDYKITGIDNYAFENNNTMMTIALPNTIKSINDYAFRNCKSLKYITVPETVTYLGKGFCSGCSSLEKVKIIPAVEKVPDSAFEGCVMLDEVELNSSVHTIGQSAFRGCSSFSDSAIFENVTSVERIAFYQSGLGNADISEGLTSIYDYTFAGCANLNRVNVPKSVSFIDRLAFSGSNNLTLGVWYDSYAYHYAIENSINYTLLDGVKLGDVNGDGYVNINDVTQIQRHLAEMEQLEGIYLHAAEANQDGTLNISDATTLQRYIAGYESPALIGEVMTQ